MSSEKTQYYSLHRWRPEDAFLRAEFNENSELVDSALHGIRQEAATGVSGVQAAVEEARRAAEEAVEGARSEALAAVSGAKKELTEALNKAKADLNAAVAAAKKEALNAAAERYGPDNPGYVSGTYTGTGLSGPEHPSALELGFRPSLVILTGPDGAGEHNMTILTAQAPSASTVLGSGDSYAAHGILAVTWKAAGVSWYHERRADYQMNLEDKTYHYLAFR